MKQFKVTLGLGRMASHHEKTFVVTAANEANAMLVARIRYFDVVEAEIGKNAPIWNKSVTVSNIEEVSI